MFETISANAPEVYTWVVIPLLIFMARIIDVSLGTIRFILISRGMKYYAPVIGFFEILIWIIAIGQIMNNLSNPICYIAYAAGFATGTFIGIWLSEKLSIGLIMIRVLTRTDATELVNTLRRKNHGVTSIDAEGKDGPVKLIFTIVKRRNAESVIHTIRTLNPKAFYSTEDIGHAQSGVFPSSEKMWKNHRWLSYIRPFRKGK